MNDPVKVRVEALFFALFSHHRSQLLLRLAQEKTVQLGQKVYWRTCIRREELFSKDRVDVRLNLAVLSAAGNEHLLREFALLDEDSVGVAVLVGDELLLCCQTLSSKEGSRSGPNRKNEFNFLIGPTISTKCCCLECGGAVHQEPTKSCQRCQLVWYCSAACRRMRQDKHRRHCLLLARCKKIVKQEVT